MTIKTNKKDTAYTNVRLILSVGFFVLSLLVSACSHTPMSEDSTVTASKFETGSSKIVTGDPFRHRIFFNQAALDAPQAKHWHIYIHGDGQAVTASGRPSEDPTPQDSLLLNMAMADPDPALVIGRPCYFHTADSQCTPLQWTLFRYSKPTVESMSKAIDLLIPADSSLTLIGYSGGATLATLLAPELPNTCGLVTLAGNLQLNQWLSHHGYSPLMGSMDPIEQPPLADSIQQFHIAGEQDKEVLWSWIEAFSEAQNQGDSQTNAHFKLLKATDHYQGWPSWWELVAETADNADSECVKLNFLPSP